MRENIISVLCVFAFKAIQIQPENRYGKLSRQLRKRSAYIVIIDRDDRGPQDKDRLCVCLL